jgi:hypothetical protein
MSSAAFLGLSNEVRVLSVSLLFSPQNSQTDSLTPHEELSHRLTVISVAVPAPNPPMRFPPMRLLLILPPDGD